MKCHYAKAILVLCCITFFFLPFSHAQKEIKSAKALIKQMHKANKGKWFNAFTFVQKTIRFDQEGAVRDSSIWYEAIQYPKNFRIDYGPLDDGNANIFRNDSVYSFRSGALQAAAINPQQFLLMKGGLYHYPVKKVLSMLTEYGYNIQQFRSDRWNGRPVYVLGAEAADEKSAQFWIDAEHFYLVRRISQASNERILDVHYSDHIASGGGWVEQTVKFYLDGRYIQLEYYQDIDTAPRLPASLFNPKAFGQEHWFDN